MTIAPELRDRIVPLAAGWYAGEYPWDTCYGTPLRLAKASGSSRAVRRSCRSTPLTRRPSGWRAPA